MEIAMVYLDHNATTPLAPEAWAAMSAAYQSGLGNASSIHRAGQAAKAALEDARASVAELVGVRPAEMVFTSGGTEADNLALQGLAMLHPGGHIVTSQVEHHAVLHTCQDLERRGWAVTYVPVDAAGRVEPEAVRQALRPETFLVSIMLANNETGVVQPVAAIAAIARQAGAKMHTDAVQAAGKREINVRELGCDLLSVSAHKIGGPQGAGALYVRRGTRLHPLLFGGHHERDRRAGTENVAAMAGFGAAARSAQAGLAAEIQRLARLRDAFEGQTLAAIPDTLVAGAGAERVPNTSDICFRYAEGEALVIALDLAGFCVSTGAACSSGALEPSHVLTAMGLAPGDARSCLRFSLGRGTTAEDMAALSAALPGVVARLRSISPACNPSHLPAPSYA
ncbi:MAG: cysteine desulfurase family protein [Terriglobales bacterium]